MLSFYPYDNWSQVNIGQCRGWYLSKSLAFEMDSVFHSKCRPPGNWPALDSNWQLVQQLEIDIVPMRGCLDLNYIKILSIRSR